VAFGGRKFLRELAIKGQGHLTDIIGKEPLKARRDFRVIGKPVQRVDIPAKVRGDFKFVHDVTVDGMVHGAVVLPPAIGARLVSVEAGEPVPGLIKVVVLKNFVGVVAETEQAALAARNRIKAVWSSPAGDTLDDIYDVIRKGTIVKDVSESEIGNVAEALRNAALVIGVRLMRSKLLTGVPKTHSLARGIAATMATACADNGATCTAPPFMRSAGSIRRSPSTSLHRRCAISERRCPVRIKSRMHARARGSSASVAFHSRASSTSVSTRSRAVSLAGRSTPNIGETVMTSRSNNQRKNTDRAA
jgi:hypothetical protein